MGKYDLDQDAWTFRDCPPTGQERLDGLAEWAVEIVKTVSFWKGDDKDKYGALPLGIECPSCRHMDVYAEGEPDSERPQRGARCTDCMWTTG